MTIQHKTARALMYSWHGGMSSAFYQAASSGMVASWDNLLQECQCMRDDPYNPQDHAKLLEWIKKQQAKQKKEIVVCGQAYAALPWIGRTYA